MEDNIKAKEYIDKLTAHGEISFTAKQMCQAMGITKKAAERAIYRLKRKDEIAAIAKGYYLILTPEFRKLGCLPPDYFIDNLMHHWQQPYYVGLLSAALYFGAAHQQPQIFYVVTSRYHPILRCGQVKIEFITKKSIADIPIKQLKTHTGIMNVSTPEATMMDLMNFTRRSGGINHVATIIDELAESINSADLKSLLEKNGELTWMQRLGFMLEQSGHHALSEIIYQRIKNQKMRLVPLVPYSSITGKERNTKWQVVINAIIESDTDDTN